ncbi:outer membrane protein assembly factor BamB family protein [Chthoniobacter flavus]|nr:PQQ-binding-like beta-propeller repeat protein [Chthoniobacter flavus]
MQTYRPDGMTTVAISLPASVTEGDAGGIGTVSISGTSFTDTVITLAPSDPARLLLPPTVTIPANQLSATFPVLAVDDALVNGSETITVSAKGPNFLFVEGRTTITVNDNESDTLALSGAAVVTKGGKYQVTISLTQAPDSDVRIALSSTNPDLSLPPFIIIPAGQSSITFDVYAEDDGIPNGTQPSNITAHVAGWTDGTVSLNVLDNGRDATTGWPTWGNGPAHSGYQPVATGGALYQAGWTSTLGSQSLGNVLVIDGVDSLNPVAITDGVLYASAVGTGNVSAADASTGVVRWQVALQGEISAPTVDAGKVYIEQIGLGFIPYGFLWRFDAASGVTDWSVPLDPFGTEPMAPVVVQDGLWMAGGTAGLYGINISDGSQRFYDPSPTGDQWTPSYRDGVTYSWASDIFSASDAVTGVRLWTLPLDGPIPNLMESDRAPAISGGQAFVVGSHALFAIDLLRQKESWRVGGTFTGTPAAGSNIVYAISNSDVLAYNAQTGALVATYSTPDSTLAGQPLVTNDTLIVSSPTQTFLFNLATQALQQTLPNGGGVSLANHILFVAGGDGVVRSYYPPGTVLADTAITQTIAPASAPNGSPVTITLTVTNAGPATATSVVVRDPLPSALTYVSATSTQGTCSASVNNVACAVGDPARGRHPPPSPSPPPRTARSTSSTRRASVPTSTTPTATIIAPRPSRTPWRPRPPRGPLSPAVSPRE